MFVGLITSSVAYAVTVFAMSGNGVIAPPVMPTLVLFTVGLIFISILGHIIIAILSPKEANAPRDERELEIIQRASHLSGIIFSVGVLCSLMAYLVLYSGVLLFYGVFFSLIISQMSEYLLHIILHRRSFT